MHIEKWYLQMLNKYRHKRNGMVTPYKRQQTFSITTKESGSLWIAPVLTKIRGCVYAHHQEIIERQLSVFLYTA